MLSDSDLILVAGATGGVGQLVVSKLLAQNISVRALTRSRNKAQKMFGNQVEIAVADICLKETGATVTKDVTQIICCSGTTAFPSSRWNFVNLWSPKNTPQAVDGKELLIW